MHGFAQGAAASGQGGTSVRASEEVGLAATLDTDKMFQQKRGSQAKPIHGADKQGPNMDALHMTAAFLGVRTEEYPSGG